MDIWDVIILICTAINIAGVVMQIYYSKQRRQDMAEASKIRQDLVDTTQENMDIVNELKLILV